MIGQPSVISLSTIALVVEMVDVAAATAVVRPFETVESTHAVVPWCST